YREVGFAVIVLSEHADHLEKNVATVNELGGASAVLTPAALTNLHPRLRPGPGTVVGYEPEGGYVDPVLATTSMLEAAQALGVTVAEGVRVVELVRSGRSVTGVRHNLGVTR